MIPLEPLPHMGTAWVVAFVIMGVAALFMGHLEDNDGNTK